MNPTPSHLLVGALQGEEHVDHVSGDEEHGGERHEPAHPLTPGWEHVVPHGQGHHLKRTEQEHALEEIKQEVR